MPLGGFGAGLLRSPGTPVLPRLVPCLVPDLATFPPTKRPSFSKLPKCHPLTLSIYSLLHPPCHLYARAKEHEKNARKTSRGYDTSMSSKDCEVTCATDSSVSSSCPLHTLSQSPQTTVDPVCASSHCSPIQTDCLRPSHAGTEIVPSSVKQVKAHRAGPGWVVQPSSTHAAVSK